MATLTVGTGSQYEFHTIAAAVAASSDGDVVLVAAGTYTNDFLDFTDSITLQAVGGLVVINATVPPPDAKAIITEGAVGANVTVSGFELNGAAVSDANGGNGAGIRYQGGNLTLFDDGIHNNQNGILAGAPVAGAGTISINTCEFAGNGSGTGATHNIYIGDIGLLQITNSYIHGAVVGHEIKSRAENTIITNNRIDDGPTGTASYSIDLPNGGNATITGNVIEQGPLSQNPAIIAYGEEGSLHAGTSVTVAGNTILNDLNKSDVSAVWNTTTANIMFSDNQVYGLTAAQLVSGTGTVSGTTLLTSEPALDTSSPWLAAPTVTTVTAAPAAGDVSVGEVAIFTLALSEPVTVSGGVPDLLLNDGGRATYDAAASSGTVLVFDYTVQSGQTTPALAVTGFDANGAVIQSPTGTSANFAGALASFANLGVNTDLVDRLNVDQQLELDYIGYFNRAADRGGLTFWAGQDTTAQSGGQSATAALTNIANAFAQQPETEALYPILSTPDLNLQSAGAQTALATFIDNVYRNLFDRAADASGKAYWLDQLTSGAVWLGAAVLAIANGALGADAIKVQNKIAVALDFTTRTGAAGLGSTSPLPAAFVTAAQSVLSGVDGVSLNDASVTAGMNATTAYIASPASVGATAANDLITISTSNTVTDPGPGSHTIRFITGVSADTIVLHSGAADQISGFNLAAGDVLDLRSLLSEAQLNIQDVLPKLGSYFTVADQGADAVLLFDPFGHGAGSAVAVLKGIGSAVANIEILSSDNAIRV